MSTTNTNNQVVVFGYDPGGNGQHGLALLYCSEENQRLNPIRLNCLQLNTAGDVIQEYEKIMPKHQIVAVGIDTLTAWSTAESGWRSADLKLRANYPGLVHSVASPNGLRGSMSLNGALLLHHIQETSKDRPMITEAHPKVVAQHLEGIKYTQNSKGLRWKDSSSDLTTALLKSLGLDKAQSKGLDPDGPDHAFDAAVGALAALKGFNKEWTTDLHHSANPEEIHPFGDTHFWWPEALKATT